MSAAAPRLDADVVRWATAMRRTQTAIAALLGLVLAYCAVVIVLDARRHDDPWDGLGIFIGFWLGLTSALGLMLTLALRTATRRGLRRHHVTPLRWSAAASALIATAWVTTIFATAIHPGADVGSWLVLLAPGLVLLPTSAATLATTLGHRR